MQTNWKKVKLKEICDLQNGYAFKSSDYIEKSNTLSCRMSNIRPGGYFDIDYNPRYLPDSHAYNYKNYLLNDGDIVIAMTDLANDPKILGVPAIIETKGNNVMLNQRVGKLVIVEEDLIDTNYLKYALSREENKIYFKQFAGGGLQINIGKEQILDLQIPLPPLPVQRKIADVLDKAERIQTKRQELIDKLDELVQSAFLDMFGDPKSSNYKEGSIRELVSEVKYGTSLKASTEGGYPYLRMNNITYKGYMDYSDLKYIDIEGKDIPRYTVRRGDLIFNRTNSKELVGKTGIFEEDAPMALAGYNIRVRTNDEANPYYIWGFLNSKFGKLILQNMCKNIVGMANINAQELQDIKLAIPPIDIQNKFEETVKGIRDNKRLINGQLELSKELFNSLMQKAFRGDLDFNER